MGGPSEPAQAVGLPAPLVLTDRGSEPETVPGLAREDKVRFKEGLVEVSPNHCESRGRPQPLGVLQALGLPIAASVKLPGQDPSKPLAWDFDPFGGPWGRSCGGLPPCCLGPATFLFSRATHCPCPDCVVPQLPGCEFAEISRLPGAGKAVVGGPAWGVCLALGASGSSPGWSVVSSSSGSARPSLGQVGPLEREHWEGRLQWALRGEPGFSKGLTLCCLLNPFHTWASGTSEFSGGGGEAGPGRVASSGCVPCNTVSGRGRPAGAGQTWAAGHPAGAAVPGPAGEGCRDKASSASRWGCQGPGKRRRVHWA